jgi:hypothetical protein
VKGRFYRKIDSRILPSLFIYKHHAFLSFHGLLNDAFQEASDFMASDGMTMSDQLENI